MAKAEKKLLTASAQLRTSWSATCPYVVIRAGNEFPRLPVHSWLLHTVSLGAGCRLLLQLCVVLQLCDAIEAQSQHLASILLWALFRQSPLGGGCLLFILCNVWADYHHWMNTLSQSLMPNLLLCWCSANFENNCHLVIFIQLLLLQRSDSVNVKVNIIFKTDLNIYIYSAISWKISSYPQGAVCL